MTSAAERLKDLKKKLVEAREENLKAADYEERQQEEDRESAANQDSKHESVKNRISSRERFKKRNNENERAVDVRSADEAEGEDSDERLRGMKRRARAMEKTLQKDTQGVQSEDNDVVTYGAVSDTTEGVDRMVNEMQGIERRRAKYRRRRTFDEDRADISFINEGNRIFNRTLDRHFDKFESVQKIKDSLERGTAQ